MIMVIFMLPAVGLWVAGGAWWAFVARNEGQSREEWMFRYYIASIVTGQDAKIYRNDKLLTDENREKFVLKGKGKK